jgi:hypothetical protein
MGPGAYIRIDALKGFGVAVGVTVRKERYVGSISIVGEGVTGGVAETCGGCGGDATVLGILVPSGAGTGDGLPVGGAAEVGGVSEGKSLAWQPPRTSSDAPKISDLANLRMRVGAA